MAQSNQAMLIQSLIYQVCQETDHQKLKAADEGDDDGYEKGAIENDSVEVKDETEFQEKEAGREKDFQGVNVQDGSADELEKVERIPDRLYFGLPLPRQILDGK